MKLPLSNRLLACCDYIELGDRVADIGCDHGYLGIHLLRSGIANRVIASDIKEAPLQSAIRNAEKFGVRDKMHFFLSNGALNISRDFDVLVCAGMGADTIISILQGAPWLKSGDYRLILQCQSKRPELRQWLQQSGYRIQRETLAKDGKFVYSIMEVVPGSAEHYTPEDAYLSPQLLQSKHPLLPEYYERLLHGLRLTTDGMRRSNAPELPQLEKILNKLEALEVMIYGNCP